MRMQTNFSRLFGCIPFVWDEKRNRLVMTTRKVEIAYWIGASICSWIYNIAVTLKFVYHTIFDTEPLPPADKIFHIFWFSTVGISSLLDFNTILFAKDFMVLANSTFQIDEKLTSKT